VFLSAMDLTEHILTLAPPLASLPAEQLRQLFSGLFAEVDPERDDSRLPDPAGKASSPSTSAIPFNGVVFAARDRVFELGALQREGG
jgi:hypothetical protein